MAIGMPVRRIPERGIDERTLTFACEVISYVRTIRYEPGIRRVLEQLVAAGGSIGANREEATSASSRKEFIRYNEIALRSAKETLRWLRVCAIARLGNRDVVENLILEAHEIADILGAIVARSKSKPHNR